MQLHRTLAAFGADVTLHHGDCVGGDALAHAHARMLRQSITIHPPDTPGYRAWCVGNEQRPQRPYLTRNRTIVDSCDVLVALPKTPAREELRSGTWATVRYARKQGVRVIVI